MLLKEIIALYFENHVIHFGLDISCGQKAFADFFLSHDYNPNRLGPPLCLVFETTHIYTPRLVGILWTRHRPVVETSALLHTTTTRDRPTQPQRDSNPQSQQASERLQALDCVVIGICSGQYASKI
jgi:hypothetical protein